MLNKEELLKAKQEGRIDVCPWYPDNISAEGKIVLHLADDVALKPPLDAETPVQVEVKTAEHVRIEHFVSNIEKDLKGYIDPEIVPGGIWGGGRPAKRIEIAMGPRTLVIPGHDGPIVVPIINWGTQPQVLKKGTPVVSIYFEPLQD